MITLNGTTPAFLPAWVRARVLSIYQLVLFGCTAAGSAAFGALAGALGASTTMCVAGLVTILTAARLLISPLPATDLDRSSTVLPFIDLPTELVTPEETTDARPVIVSVRYTVPTADQSEFMALMPLLRSSRRRTGAGTWSLYQDPDASRTYVELFTVHSWREHVSQHEGRQTGYDESLIERAHALSSNQPTIEHLLEVPVKPKRGEERRASP